MVFDPTAIASGVAGGFIQKAATKIGSQAKKKATGDDSEDITLQHIAEILMYTNALLTKIANDATTEDIPNREETIRLSPSTPYTIKPDEHRDHTSLLVKTQFMLTVNHPTIGAITKQVNPGWLRLEMPYGTDLFSDTPQFLMFRYSTIKLGVDF